MKSTTGRNSILPSFLPVYLYFLVKPWGTTGKLCLVSTRVLHRTSSVFGLSGRPGLGRALKRVSDVDRTVCIRGDSIPPVRLRSPHRGTQPRGTDPTSIDTTQPSPVSPLALTSFRTDVGGVEARVDRPLTRDDTDHRVRTRDTRRSLVTGQFLYPLFSRIPGVGH